MIRNISYRQLGSLLLSRWLTQEPILSAIWSISVRDKDQHEDHVRNYPEKVYQYNTVAASNDCQFYFDHLLK